MCVLKIFFWDNSKYFEMSLQYFEEKNIFLSQYQNISSKNECLVCNVPNADWIEDISLYLVHDSCISFHIFVNFFMLFPV